MPRWAANRLKSAIDCPGAHCPGERAAGNNYATPGSKQAGVRIIMHGHAPRKLIYATTGSKKAGVGNGLCGLVSGGILCATLGSKQAGVGKFGFCIGMCRGKQFKSRLAANRLGSANLVSALACAGGNNLCCAWQQTGWGR
eukprot:scaffold200421_cov16-Tisochrysis_lutea.AAC.3